MKRIVADLVAGTHRNHRLPRRLQGSAMEVGVAGPPVRAPRGAHPFVREMRGELPPQERRGR